MSIQGSINQAIGSVGQTAAISKALKQQDPEYQKQKAKEAEASDIQTQREAVEAANKQVVESAGGYGNLVQKAIDRPDSPEATTAREIAGKQAELDKRAFYNEPTESSYKRMKYSSIESQTLNKMYDAQKQRKANMQAIEQQQAKAEQKTMILTNINR